MSNKYPTRLEVNNELPDFLCPSCETGLDWHENLYAFNKEYVVCSECEHKFYIKQSIKHTYELSSS